MTCTIIKPPVIPGPIEGCPPTPGVCPVPDAAVSTSYAKTSSVKVTPPAPVDEGCGNGGGKTTSGGSGGTSSQIVYVPVAGPQGPQGEKGEDGECGQGFEWRDQWKISQFYQTYTEGEHCNSSVVMFNGSTYICIQTHGSTPDNRPGNFWSDEWREYWQDFTQEGKVGLPGIGKKLKSLLEGNFKDILDWSNWSIGDWAKTIAVVAGGIWVGTKVKDMMKDKGGVESGAADFRFNGSPGYAAKTVHPTLPDVVARVCARAGLQPHQYDVSKLPTDQLVYGTAITGSATDILTGLKHIFGFDIIKATQQLIFIPYNLPPVAHIPDSDMGFEQNKSSLSKRSVSRLQSSELPKKVSVTFKSPAMYYHEDSEKTELFTFKNGNEAVISLPFVLSKRQAKDISERVLSQSHAQANTTSFTLPYKYMDLQPGDNLTTDRGEIRIISIDENPNNVLNITATGANDIDYTLRSSNQHIQEESINTNQPDIPGFSSGILLDLPPLNSNDSKPRLLAAVHGFNVENWPGCQIYETKDGGASYDIVGSTSRDQATVGIVDQPVGQVAEHDLFKWDFVNTITVRLKTGQLLSAPNNLAVYNGANTCLIGSEIISFRFADLIDTDADGIVTYELSGLLRGLNGTDWSVNTHDVDELFVLLDDTLVELEFPLDERGRERTYRFVTNGSDPSVTEDQTVTPYMLNKLPWRVSKLKGQAMGSTKDYGIEWEERPSFDNQMQDFRQSTKDMDEWGGWAVAVMNPDNLDGPPIHTEFVYEPNWIFTEAHQVELFGSVQSCVCLRVIPMSKVVAGGYHRDIWVN